MLNVMYQRLLKPAMFRIKDVHPNKPLRFLGHPKDSRETIANMKPLFSH